MIALLLLLLSIPAGTPVPIGIRFTGGGYDGVLITPGDAWKVTAADVAEAEAGVAALFKTPRYKNTRMHRELPRYKRQYWAISRGAHKILVVLGFHETQGPVSTNEWTNRMYTVAGGGDYFFRAEYDFVTKKATGGPNGPK